MDTPHETTEIIVNERGDETHPSWVAIRANRVSHSGPGKRLHDSEIRHQHYVIVTVRRLSRKRDLHRDWHFEYGVPLVEMSMSMAQWGAFVSSFGQGTGVPVTLDWYGPENYVPGEPTEADSRLALSAAEVQKQTAKSIDAVESALADVLEAFDAGVSKKALREKLNALTARVRNMPANAKFAADSLTEHTEAVVTKARFDIEAMVAQHAETLGLNAADIADSLAIGSGDV
jgi:hypothetical protein